jgi:hypothetical protein
MSPLQQDALVSLFRRHFEVAVLADPIIAAVSPALRASYVGVVSLMLWRRLLPRVATAHSER